jgi:hypothetical protein
MACEITPHLGNTRANIPYARLKSPAAAFIAGHYTYYSPSLSEGLPLRKLIRIGLELGLFFHVDYGERFTVHQRNRNGFHGDIALYAEEFCSG